MLRLCEGSGMAEGEVSCDSVRVARGVVVKGAGMERSQFWVEIRQRSGYFDRNRRLDCMGMRWSCVKGSGSGLSC